MYSGSPADRPGTMVARVLGGRQVVQSLLTGRSPTVSALTIGVAVDMAHAASMVTLAAVDSGRRRAARIDAAVAVGFAAAGLTLAMRTRAGDAEGDRRTTREGSPMTKQPHQPDAIEVLEREDRELRQLFEQLAEPPDPSVESRSARGTLCKHLIRRVALREAAKMDIVRSLASRADLQSASARLTGSLAERRGAISRLDELARGVPGMDLNSGQNVDEAIIALRRVVAPEIDWELAEGTAAIRTALSADHRTRPLHGERYLRWHAPTRPPSRLGPGSNPLGITSVFRTAWDHLRDRPRPVKGQRVGDTRPGWTQRSGELRDD